jgi:hypothetical protein
MTNQDFERNRYRNRFQEDDRSDDPGYYDRAAGRSQPGEARRTRAMRPDQADWMDRGAGSGESPYTSNPPDYSSRIGTGESPYTDYGPRLRAPYRETESPYTRHPPRRGPRYGSGESPYTDYGPIENQDRAMGYDPEQPFYGPASFTYTEIWMIPGPHTGRGPQGYRRSDERILEEINYRLTMHGQLDAREINAQVNNGEVTLTGSVESRRARRLAEDIADSVTGVMDIHNELKVATHAPRSEEKDVSS